MAKLVFKDHPHKQWRTGHDFPDVPLTQISWDTAADTPVAYVYFGHVNIDFDGSPTAYGPDGIQPMPDDDLGHAWDNDKGWFGVLGLRENHPFVTGGQAIIDKKPALLHKGKYPVIQQARPGGSDPSDPNPGFYVSTTPHATGPLYLQDSYVDASQISFGALSGKLRNLGFDIGDYGLAIRHDRGLYSGFYFVDAGADNYALGECSHKVGKNLGGSGRSDGFDNNYPVSFIVFPESGTIDPGKPEADGTPSAGTPSISDGAIQADIRPLLANLSVADNADDLPLLMGFNEVDPLNRPEGLSKLKSYRASPVKTAKPVFYNNIVRSLLTLGYHVPPQPQPRPGPQPVP